MVLCHIHCPQKVIQNSVRKQKLPDGSPYRERELGPDGRVVVDYNHHPGGSNRA